MSLALIPLCRTYFFGALEDTFKMAPSEKYGMSPILVPSEIEIGLLSSRATSKSLIEILSFLAS